MKLINYHPQTLIFFNWAPSVGLVGNWNQWSNQEDALIKASNKHHNRTIINFKNLEEKPIIVSDNGIEALGTKARIQQGLNYLLSHAIYNAMIQYNPLDSLKSMFHFSKIYILPNHPLIPDLQELLGKENVIIITPPPLNNSLHDLETYLMKGKLHDYFDEVGANYQVQGIVKKAKQLGRTIGFPTANLTFKKSLPIREGVYLVKVWLPNEDQPRWGMGDYWNPTDYGYTFETYIFDFDQDIYDWNITIELVHYYRGNQKVKDVKELKTLLTNDYQSLRKLTK